MNHSLRKLGLWFAALTVVACGGGGTAAAPKSPPRLVALVPVGTADLPDKAAVSGVLAAQEELVLGLEVAGRLATLAVDVGDVVAAEAAIATLAPAEFELTVLRAEAQLTATLARLGPLANAGLDTLDVDATPPVREAQAVVVEVTLRRDRIASMVQERVQSAADLEAAAATLAVAESRLQRARDEVRTWLAESQLRRVELQQARKRQLDSAIKAPWAGRVGARHATAGQVLTAGSPVVTLLRVHPLRLRLRVPDRLAMGIEIGQAVEFTVDGGALTLHQGRVVRTGAAIERGDRTRLVEVEVQNPDHALLPGAFCRAHIVTAAAVARLMVPRTAVLTFAGVDRVFTVEPGPDGQLRAKGQIVEIGRTVGDLVEVLTGLKLGVNVVREATGLAAGVVVLVAE